MKSASYSLEGEQPTKEPKTARRIRYVKQCLIVMIAGLVSIPSGMIQLWPNVLASHYAQTNETIFGNEIYLADWQMDLVASVTQIGGLVGYLTAGYLVSSLGRRWSLVITAIPGIFGSVLITLAVSTYMIIAGRFLDGITNGMMNVAVFVYVSEISDLKIRGSMLMLSHLLMQSGGIFTISLGIVFSWYYMSLICGCILVLHCLLIPTLNESPSFLAIKSQDNKALKVLRKLRGNYADVEEELSYLQKHNLSDDKKQGYALLLKKEHLKKIGLMSGIFFIHNFCGTQVLRVNATRQLQNLGLNMDEKLTTILVVCVLFIGNLIMALILDKFGRRRCIMLSLAILVVSYTTLGAFVHIVDTQPSLIELDINELSTGLNDTVRTTSYLIVDSSTSVGIKDWLPLLCLCSAAFGHSMGIGPLVWVLAPEMFPTSLRSQGTGICTMIGSLQTFVVLQLFSQMQITLTPAGLYWFFASVSFGGIFYIYFLLKETSGTRVG